MTGRGVEFPKANLNHNCYVKLTDAGLETYYRYQINVKDRSGWPYAIPRPPETRQGAQFLIYD